MRIYAGCVVNVQNSTSTVNVQKYIVICETEEWAIGFAVKTNEKKFPKDGGWTMDSCSMDVVPDDHVKKAAADLGMIEPNN